MINDIQFVQDFSKNDKLKEYFTCTYKLPRVTYMIKKLISYAKMN